MHFLITAGPTREPIDPVRYLSNRSSGKMGYALAAAALKAGHTVTLISGPVHIDPPPGCDLVPVETAAEMYEAVAVQCAKAQCSIHCAAVADYTPKSPAEQKLKKSGGSLKLELVPTKDILGSMREALGFTGLLVGFAAETGDLEANATDKLKRKGCDILVANDVSIHGSVFDSDANEVSVFFAKRPALYLKRMAKRDLAEILIGICQEMAETSAP